MNKRALVLLAVSTFLTFGVLLGVSIGLSADDRTNDLESQISDLEYRIERIEDRSR